MTRLYYLRSANDADEPMEAEAEGPDSVRRVG
jgi:hypothetical protein